MDFVVIMFWMGYVSFICLIGILFFFGRVIKDTFLARLLSKKGYYCVEILFPDSRWRSFFLKPKGSHFDIDDG